MKDLKEYTDDYEAPRLVPDIEDAVDASGKLLNQQPACDKLLNAEVQLQKGDEVMAERVTQRALDPDGRTTETYDDNDGLADVPDLRYYLDPQAVEVMRGLSEQQLVDKINQERSAEAAYWLAGHYREDEATHTSLMLIAAAYSRKSGLLIDAINGCCAWTPGDSAGERAANIRRQALSMIAKELGLPEAQQWPDLSPAEEMTAEVLEQREAYVAEINRHSIAAHGEEWIK